MDEAIWKPTQTTLYFRSKPRLKSNYIAMYILYDMYISYSHTYIVWLCARF